MIDLFKKVINSYVDSGWEISLAFKSESIRSLSYLNGKKENFNKSVSAGVMVSVGKNGKVFRQATPIIKGDYLKTLIDQGIKNFNILEPNFLSESSMSIHTGEVYDLSLEKPLLLKSFSDSLATSSSVNHKWIDFIRSSLSENLEERIIVNSQGGVFHDKKYFTDYYLDLMGSRDQLNQNRSNGGVVFQGAVDDSFLLNTLEKKESLTRELDLLLSASPCPKMVGDLLLPSDQMYIQIHESIGHPLELDRISGDERNYAGGSFVKKDDFGQLRYGPEIMNVVFAPSEKKQPVGYEFDDTGLKAADTFLIKDGILRAGIGGAESQKRLGVLGTSSTRNSSWNRPPIDRMGNINLCAGESRYEDMIKSIENGVLMKTNRSWSIDDQRDKFQFGCEIGYLIKDGEVKNVVRSPNYEGRTIPFWNSLKMVGDRNTVDDFGTSNCGKGEPNQAVRVGHQSPACLFSNISIFAGE